MRQMKEGQRSLKYNVLLGLPYMGVVLALIGIAPYDLALNQYLYNPQNPLAVLFERWILCPIELLAVLCFYVLYRAKRQRRYALCALLTLWIVSFDTLKYWTSDLLLYGLVCVSALTLALCFHWLMRERVQVDWGKYEPFCRYFLTVFLSSFLLTFLLKSGWGRVRFREMNGDWSLFTPWYQINGFTHHQSFPSAHSAVMSTLLCFWRPCAKVHQGKFTWLLRILIIGLIGAMMILRMMAGAHFFSDVLVGFLLTYTMVIICRPIEKGR
ncbi:MAG: phosphatase PAP2 family protein [Erysipelotrichaceae bacterium]|nr:phosphatase PAP2 family protein [Erysipelotrichaceae bacterium]